MAVIARHLIIRGKVQGVWFRGWTVETATSLGLVGWVRNRTGGEVEVVVQGEKELVDQFLIHVWSGPPAAHVTAVEVSPGQPSALNGFRQRATA